VTRPGLLETFAGVHLPETPRCCLLSLLGAEGLARAFQRTQALAGVLFTAEANARFHRSLRRHTAPTIQHDSGVVQSQAKHTDEKKQHNELTETEHIDKEQRNKEATETEHTDEKQQSDEVTETAHIDEKQQNNEVTATEHTDEKQQSNKVELDHDEDDTFVFSVDQLQDLIPLCKTIDSWVDPLEYGGVTLESDRALEDAHLPESALSDLEVICEGLTGDIYRALLSLDALPEESVLCDTGKASTEISSMQTPATASRTPVALTHFHEESEFEEFRSIASQLRRFRCPTLVRVYGYVELSNGICGSVAEFLPGGTLLSRLEEQGRLSWDHTVGVALDVARALHFLHAQLPPIFHRNITAANVLFPDPTQCAATYPRPARLNAVRLSTSVAPLLCKEIPETRAGQGAYTEKSDVYCFGHLLWIMAFPSGMVDLLNPWAAFDAEHLPTDTPASLAELIHACVDHNPSRRPSMDEIIETLESINTSYTSVDQDVCKER